MSINPLTLQSGIHRANEYSNNFAAKDNYKLNTMVQQIQHNLQDEEARQRQQVTSSEKALYNKITSNSNESKKNDSSKKRNKQSKNQKFSKDNPKMNMTLGINIDIKI